METQQSNVASRLNLEKLADPSKYQTIEKFKRTAYTRLFRLFGVEVNGILFYRNKSRVMSLDDIANTLIQHDLVVLEDAQKEAKKLLGKNMEHGASPIIATWTYWCEKTPAGDWGYWSDNKRFGKDARYQLIREQTPWS